jgi:hypothetical protein
LTVAQQYFTGGWGSLFPKSAPQKQEKPRRLTIQAKPEEEEKPQLTEGNGGENGSEKTATPVGVSAGSKKGKKKRGKKS